MKPFIVLRGYGSKRLQWFYYSDAEIQSVPHLEPDNSLDLHLHKYDEDFLSKIYSSSGVRLARCKVGMSSQSLLLFARTGFPPDATGAPHSCKDLYADRKETLAYPEDKTNVLG